MLAYLPPGMLSAVDLARSGSSVAGTSADSLLDVLALGDAMAAAAAAGGGFGAAAPSTASARPSPSSIGITLAVATCSFDRLGAASQLIQLACTTRSDTSCCEVVDGNTWYLVVVFGNEGKP